LHTANLCNHWNDVVDLCNGQFGPHTPENVIDRQKHFLMSSTTYYFSGWKAKHDLMVSKEAATKYNFFCIQPLLRYWYGASLGGTL
jgi:hypothetical protein